MRFKHLCYKIEDFDISRYHIGIQELEFNGKSSQHQRFNSTFDILEQKGQKPNTEIFITGVTRMQLFSLSIFKYSNFEPSWMKITSLVYGTWQPRAGRASKLFLFVTETYIVQ